MSATFWAAKKLSDIDNDDITTRTDKLSKSERRNTLAVGRTFWRHLRLSVGLTCQPRRRQRNTIAGWRLTPAMEYVPSTRLRPCTYADSSGGTLRHFAAERGRSLAHGRELRRNSPVERHFEQERKHGINIFQDSARPEQK
jgi:hypothetical protein